MSARDKLALHRVHRKHTIYAETDVAHAYVVSAKMWLLAMALVFAWLCLPLTTASSADDVNAVQNAWLYVLLHQCMTLRCAALRTSPSLQPTSSSVPSRVR